MKYILNGDVTSSQINPFLLKIHVLKSYGNTQFITIIHHPHFCCIQLISHVKNHPDFNAIIVGSTNASISIFFEICDTCPHGG